ncbi:MAG: protein translocase subunit SecF [Acidobacteriota bacterium]
MQIFVNSKYDFVRWRLYAVAFSVIFILVGFSLFAMRGINLGIDFAGGANIVLKFQDEISPGQIRSLLPDAVIQQYGKTADQAFLIRLPKSAREEDYAGNIVARLHTALNPNTGDKLDLNFHGRDALADLLKADDPDHKGTNIDAQTYYADVAQNVISKRSEVGIFHNVNEVTSAPGVTASIASDLSRRTYLGRFNVLNQETVGPQVGRELQRKALLAVVLAALAMGVYITIRFDLKFGVSAIVCIIHDVLVSFAFLFMLNAEFDLNVVAALLLIVGYSINDTVVLFDRVRENQKKTRARQDFKAQLNLAMNQTLSRTVLTSLSTALVLFALVLFGGRVIHTFAMILLVGVMAGTYSTVTIVPAMALAWDRVAGGKSPVKRATVESTRPTQPAPVPKTTAKRAKG